MNLRFERRPATAVAVLFACTLPLWASQARAENNVAPTLVLRQQASDGASTANVLQQAMADASQSQPQGINTKTEAK